MIGATIRNTANPTMLEAGYKANVIPSRAEATIDTRFLPGHEDELLEDDRRAARRRRRARVRSSATSPSRPRSTARSSTRCPRRCVPRTPARHPVPYLMSGGTDAKSFSTLGIRCFGFSPLRLPADLDFLPMFHGIDERVPVDGLQFGVRVLDRLLRSS